MTVVRGKQVAAGARQRRCRGETRRYRHEGKRARLRLLEKGNKEKLVWLHREAEEFVDAYIAAAGIDDKEAPLFQAVDKVHRFSGEAITRRNMLRVVKSASAFGLRCARP